MNACPFSRMKGMLKQCTPQHSTKHKRQNILLTLSFILWPLVFFAFLWMACIIYLWLHRFLQVLCVPLCLKTCWSNKDPQVRCPWVTKIKVIKDTHVKQKCPSNRKWAQTVIILTMVNPMSKIWVRRQHLYHNMQAGGWDSSQIIEELVQVCKWSPEGAGEWGVTTSRGKGRAEGLVLFPLQIYVQSQCFLSLRGFTGILGCPKLQWKARF